MEKIEENNVPQIEKELFEKGYELRSQIGTGATAFVYRVKDTAASKIYACKVSDKKEWLGLEAKLLQSLHHPLFPGWKEYWEHEEKGYLVMEYIEGSNLEQHLERRGHFSREETIRMALEMADGLGYLHARSPMVIYRDLKPANIIVQTDGQVRLLDLGAAAIPEGWKAGTPGYASPEQQISKEASGEKCKLTSASDIYTLGVVMHYMLTGQNPCKSKQKMLPVRAYNPAVWRGLEDIVWRCVRPKPEERIPGMRELIQELSTYYNRSNVQIARQELEVLFGKWRKKQVLHDKDVWESCFKTDLER